MFTEVLHHFTVKFVVKYNLFMSSVNKLSFLHHVHNINEGHQHTSTKRKFNILAPASYPLRLSFFEITSSSNFTKEAKWNLGLPQRQFYLLVGHYLLL